MASFKKLSTSDVFVTPYAANKEWSLDFSCVPQDGAYFTIYKGKNLTGSFSLDDPITEGKYERLLYRSINHLFYQHTSASALDTQSLYDSIYYDSLPTSSGTILKESSFNFNIDPGFINAFPTGANDIIRVITFNQEIYGSELKPYQFYMESEVFTLIDDGKGNITDQDNSNVHVGNIFYSQGIVVITNQDYKFFVPSPPNAINDHYKILNTQKTKLLDIFANDVLDGITSINTDSLMVFNHDGYFFPTYSMVGAEISITPYETESITPGTYKIDYQMYDTSCMLSNLATVELTIYKNPLQIILSEGGAICSGGASGFNFGVDFGQPPYKYSLDGTTYTDIDEWYQPTQSLSLTEGDYTLYIKDNDNDIVSSSFSIVARSLSINPTITNVSCFGAANGSIVVAPSGSTGAPYRASIDGGTTWSTDFTTSKTYNSLSPGTYNVVVADANCQTSQIISITQPSALFVNVNSITSDCAEPGQSTGVISITVSGGTSPYSYAWHSGSTLISTNEDPSGLPAGTYTVQVTDTNSCTFTSNPITVDNTNLISIALSPTNGSCGGSGSISSNVTGGSGNYSYSWSNGATTHNITNVSSGSYTLTITDNTTGCHISASTSVTTTPAIFITSASVDYSDECTSKINTTVSGGVAPFTFIIQNGGTSYSAGPQSGSNAIISNNTLNSGSWTVNVHDLNGCSATTTVNVRGREWRYSTPTCQEENDYQNQFYFQADYIVLTYQFTNGSDLDTRTRIVTPNIGQTAAGDYIGWGQQSIWPSVNPILKWGGNNTGTGYESVLIDLIQFKSQYPSSTKIVIDMRSQWYSTVGTQPVVVDAKLYRGGTMVGPTSFTFTNPTATATATVDSAGKVMSNSSTVGSNSGNRVATLTYNLITNSGIFDTNDTTTPSV
jgi:hypothetical protein